MQGIHNKKRFFATVIPAVVINGLVLSQYIYYWLNSTPSDFRIVYALSLFLTLEFLGVFIGVWLAVRSTIKIALLTMVPLTCFFAFMISYQASYYWFFFIYLLVIANKVRHSSAFNDYNNKGYNFMFSWAAVILFLLVTITINIFESFVPDFSLAPSVVSKYSYFDEENTNLIFYDQAKSNMAFGCLFYFFMMILEVCKEWMFQVYNRK